MNDNKFITPAYITAAQMKELRKKLNLTQKEFAYLIHVSKATVERWEASNTPIDGPIVLVLELLKRNIGYVEEIKVPDKVYPLRLYYMHEQTLCTLIDVDEINKKILIRNYTDNIMLRAFGIKDEPDYADYEEFLEARCFPEGRDKMKLLLKELNLPFYDPFMIIEKTEGRMAEDNFWIKIER